MPNKKKKNSQTYPTQFLHFNGIVNEATTLFVHDAAKYFCNVRIDLGAHQHQSQFGGPNAGTIGVARQNLHLQFELGQLHGTIEKLADTQFGGGMLEQIVE